MAYQRSTKADGFKQRKVVDLSKQQKELAANLEKDNRKVLAQFQKVSNQQLQELARTDKLDLAGDKYELENLRGLNKEFNNFLDTLAKDVAKPIFDNEVEDGINQGILAAQGDKEALDKMRLDEIQELDLEKRANELVEKTEFTTEALKAKYEKDIRNDIRNEYRLLNLKKHNSNFARGYRKGLLMEAATGWDAYRDSVLTNSSDYEIQDQIIVVDGEEYRIGDYYNIPSTKRNVRQEILATVQADYIRKEGAGFKQSLVNTHLTKPVIERTNLWQQKEFNKEQVELGNERLEDLSVKFKTNFANLESDIGQMQATAVVQHALNILPSTMKMIGVEGSYNAAAKQKLLEMIVGKGSLLENSELSNQDDMLDILDFLDQPRFYIKGVSKMVNGQLQLSSFNDLMAGSYDRDEIHGKMLQEQYTRSTNEINGKKNALKETLQRIDIQHADNPIAKSLELNKLYVQHYGMAWAKSILNGHDNGSLQDYAGTAPLSKNASIARMQELERLYNVQRVLPDGEKHVSIIPITSVHLDKIHPEVLAQYIEDGKVADPYKDSPGAYSLHSETTASLMKEVEAIFKTETKDTLSAEQQELQLDKFTEYLSPQVLSYALQYKQANDGITLREGILQAKRYLLDQIKGQNSLKREVPAGFVLDQSLDFKIDSDGFSESIYSRESKGVDSPTNIEVKIRNKLSNVATEFSNFESPNLFETKLFFNENDRALFDLTNDGKVGTIFHTMSKLSEGTTPPELIYNQQAKLLDPTLVKEWDEETQREIDAWLELDLNQRKTLISGETEGYNRVIVEAGYISPYNILSSLVSTDGQLPLRPEEANLYLAEMGLPSKEWEQIVGDPKLLETLLHFKIKKAITATEGLTNNDNIRVRMVAAYMASGDVNNWNEKGYNKFTISALSAYRSGDTSALTPFLSKFNLGNGNSLKVDYSINESYIHPEGSIHNEEIPSDFLGVQDMLLRLQKEEVPAQFIVNPEHYEGEVAGIGPISGLIKRIVTRKPQFIGETTAYIEHKNLETKLTNLRTVYQQLEGRGNIPVGVLNLALHDVLGTEKWNEVKRQASELFRRGKFTSLDDARMSILIQQPEFAKVKIAQRYLDLNNYELSVDPARYDVGGDLTGKIKREDLVPIKGFAWDDTGLVRTKQKTFFIRKDASKDWFRLFKDAKANGHSFGINDGYRTLDDQKRLLDKKAKSGSEVDVAEVGKSNHNAGVSLDLSWATGKKGEAAYAWLLENYTNYNLCPHTGTPTTDMNSGWNKGETEAWHWSWDPTGSCKLEGRQ
tara:strand:- start:5699 stop:9544 length:3846 start_codon:yes stop_codon:yes gene_type:complete